MNRDILLVLAKAPCAGKVKTRLCPPATPRQAARIAAAALLDTLDAVCALPGVEPVVALSGSLSDAEYGPIVRRSLNRVAVVPQRGDSLGERIAAAHADAAERFPGRPILQIGMDTPQADPALLQLCRERLGAPGTDAVLGPATDGGWWLLGLRDPRAAACITAVPTSCTDTGTRTAEALCRSGLRLGTVPELSDVDTSNDARRVAAAIPQSRFAAAVRDL